MNQNWIVENLNNAFSTWNGKLTELWGLVTTSPQTFKGGAVCNYGIKGQYPAVNGKAADDIQYHVVYHHERTHRHAKPL